MPLIVLSSLLLVVIDTCLQYEVFQRNVRALDYLQGSRVRVAVSVMTCMAVHVAQISMFGTLYWSFSSIMHISGFVPSGKSSFYDDIFFSAETFTSVGYGERVPVGVMRIPAIAESLNGLMMLGWSGSYLMRVRQHAEMLRF